MRDGQDELDKTLADYWWDRVPETETQLAGRLSKPMRDMVAKRMQVLLRRERASVTTRPLAADAATALGVSRPRFYAMAKEYYETRSIAALGARAAEKRTRPARLDPAVRSATVDLIEAVLQEDPDASVASIATRLADAGVPAMSYSMVRRLWLEARRSEPPGAFGDELLFDSVGLDAVSNGERMRLYVLLDRGTGIVLGVAAAGNASRSQGFVMAALDAECAIFDGTMSGISSTVGRPKVLLHRQRDDDTGADALLNLLLERGFQCEVRDTALGRATIRAVGERLGSVWLGAGERDDDVSYRNGRRARMPEYTETLGRTLKAAILEHNQGRLKAARAVASSVGSTIPDWSAISRIVGLVAGAGEVLAALPSYSDTKPRPVPRSDEVAVPPPDL